jgi:glycine hydroxymethyltransferase
MPSLRTEPLATERLRLEPLHVAHAAEMVPTLSASELYGYTGGEPPDIDTLTERYHALVLGSPDPGEEWHNWILRSVETGDAVGFVQATVEGDSADVAWVTGHPWQGRGFATEATSAMCDWLTSKGVKQLAAHIHPRHAASQRVAEANGFERTGQVDDEGEDVWQTTTHAGSPSLRVRPWVPQESEARVQTIATETAGTSPERLGDSLDALIDRNRRIHDVECVNLNPATNTMNPRAEAALASGLGPRTSLGYPGDKYEMGLEAIEQIEVIAAELAATVFDASFAEVRVPSGAMANLYAFMACARPGDSIIVPPATIAGHVTHHPAGAAGLCGLDIHEAPIDADRYTVDTDALGAMAERIGPKVISVGSSLNLTYHDVGGIRAVADAVGAKVLFDAAHLSGIIAGRAWPNPLHEGAHIMTMSTYKSLAGPPSGLLVTNDAAIAERVDAIAFPGLTANFDVGKTAALAVTLLDWLEYGTGYAEAMVQSAARLAASLSGAGIAVYRDGGPATLSHAFALDARTLGGGHRLAKFLRRANLLTSAIGLPGGLDDGLRIGTNEIVRWGAGPDDMDALAELVARALAAPEPEALQADVSAFRSRFDTIHYARVDRGTPR